MFLKGKVVDGLWVGDLFEDGYLLTFLAFIVGASSSWAFISLQQFSFQL